MQHQFYGCDSLLGTLQSWIDDKNKDVATAEVTSALWNSLPHHAKPVPRSLFAAKHAPVEMELIFFRGLAGENARLAFGVFERTLTGYCSQEVPNGGDGQIFEILWSPPNTTITAGTDSNIRSTVRFNDARGFSGSLVWNTRFVELGCDLNKWSPKVAQVTGLLRRWDTTTASLLALRVEHLLAWL